MALELLVDVDAPLVGPDGAAHRFGPQKRARPEQVAAFDAALRAADELRRRGAHAVHPLDPPDRPLEQALAAAAPELESAARTAVAALP